MRSETKNVKAKFAGALLAGSIVLLGWSSVAEGQSSRFMARSKPDAKVSIRDMRIPPKARDEFNKGLRQLEKRNSTKSLRHFEEAVRNFPNYYEAYYNEGVADMQLQHNEEAMQKFQKAIELSDGKYARAEFGYGLALMREGKIPEAEQVLRHGLQTEPDNVDGHVVLGFVLLKQNRLDEAERHGQEALEENDRNAAKGYLVLADAAGARADYQEQARNLDAYLNAVPKDPNKKTLQAARDVAQRLASRKNARASKTNMSASN